MRTTAIASAPSSRARGSPAPPGIRGASSSAIVAGPRIAAAIIYTGGPWPIGYHALGDLFTFVFFGLAAVVGTYYVQAGNAPAIAWLAAVPLGCTVTMILVINNLRDIPTDSRTGKTTLGVVMGDRGTRTWYLFLLAVAYVSAIATWAAGAPLSSSKEPPISGAIHTSQLARRSSAASTIASSRA